MMPMGGMHGFATSSDYSLPSRWSTLVIRSGELAEESADGTVMVREVPSEVLEYVFGLSGSLAAAPTSLDEALARVTAAQLPHHLTFATLSQLKAHLEWMEGQEPLIICNGEAEDAAQFKATVR